MHTSSALLLTSLLALFSPIASAPADPSATPGSKGCIVPEIAFISLDKPFTLQALVLKAGSIPFPVQLPQPSVQTATQPYISRTKIAQPLFRLTGGNLTTGGANHKKFPAYFGPKIKIFPPVLDSILFGGGDTNAQQFFAGYACDANNVQYLELRTNERRKPFPPPPQKKTSELTPSPTAFVVPQLPEDNKSEKIYAKPNAFAGPYPIPTPTPPQC